MYQEIPSVDIHFILTPCYVSSFEKSSRNRRLIIYKNSLTYWGIDHDVVTYLILPFDTPHRVIYSVIFSSSVREVARHS